MKVVINNKIFLIKFRYGEQFYNNDVRRYVQCLIQTAHENKEIEPMLISSSLAICDTRDVFIKAKGRALAFVKALQKLFTDEKYRTNNNLSNKDFQEFLLEFKKKCPSSIKFL